MVNRIQERCDSDGVYVALRALMQKSAWRPRQLADQITKGPHALKPKAGQEVPKDQISVEQLLHFLERRQIAHTDAALAFLLQRCGSSSASKRPLKVDRFVASFEEIVPTPLVVGKPLGSMARGASGEKVVEGPPAVG